MATINLLPRKEFEITTDDGTVIKGQFGTWALKRFCDKRGVSLNESTGALNTLGGLVDYILAAVEYTARKGSQPFSYTDIHACEWIDELGGIGGALFTSLIKHSEDENASPETEEKKTGEGN